MKHGYYYCTIGEGLFEFSLFSAGPLMVADRVRLECRWGVASGAGPLQHGTIMADVRYVEPVVAVQIWRLAFQAVLTDFGI